jgi:MFS family permease
MKLRILALTSLAHYINDGCGIAYATIYPIFISRGYSYLDISYVSSSYLVTSAVFSIFMGRLGDLVKRPSMLLGFGMALWSLAILILGLSIYYIGEWFSATLLYVSAFIGGIASSIYHPVGASILSSYFISERGLALGINGAMGALGRTTYPLIITILLSITSAGLIPLALISMASSIIIILLIGGLARSGSRETGEVSMAIPKEAMPSIAILTSIAMARGILSQGVVTYLATFINQRLGVSYGIEVGALTSLALAGSIVSQPFLGMLSDKLGRDRTMLLTTIMGSLSIYGFLELYRYTIVSYILLFLFGVFAFEAFTLLLSYVSDLVPQRYVSTANSIVWGLGLTAGGSIGPIIVGATASMISLEAGFTLAASINMLTIPMIYIASRKHVQSPSTSNLV